MFVILHTCTTKQNKRRLPVSSQYPTEEMVQSYALALASLVCIASGGVPQDCCKQKTVGGRSFTLVGMEDTSVYNCLTDCVYQADGDPDQKLFCFAAGNLEVVCEEELGSWGEQEPEPVGEKSSAGGSGGGADGEW